MPGPHRTRADELRALRRRTPRYRVPFPDLSVEHRTSPCSNAIAYHALGKNSVAPKVNATFSVGHCHKQGLELITPWMSQFTHALSGNKQ